MRLPSPSPGFRRLLRWCRNGFLCGAAVYLGAGFLSLRLVRGPVTVAAADLTPSVTSGTLPGAVEDGGGAESSRDWTVVRGALSVHGERSHDAEGSMDQVAAAAARSGLDFVFLGDHPGDWIEEGSAAMAPFREEGVLVVPGLELVVSGAGRVLAVGIDTLTRRWEGEVSALSSRADSLDAFLSVVHPRSPRSRERWDGLGAPGIHAWESFDISEMARLRLEDPWAGYHVVSFLSSLVVGRGEAGLRGLWRERTTTPALLSYDSARAAEPLVLTGGLNHHPKARWGGLLFPAYEPFFRTVVNHVAVEGSGLARDPLAARQQIIRGLKAGRVYVTLGDPEGAAGFHFEGIRGTGGKVPMGGAGSLGSGSTLHVRLPDGGSRRILVRVLRDGEEEGWVEARRGEEVHWPVDEPGIYRVEVFRAGPRLAGFRFGLHPWILSNPVEFYPATGA